jgi:hypothetical protein
VIRPSSPTFCRIKIERWASHTHAMGFEHPFQSVYLFGSEAFFLRLLARRQVFEFGQHLKELLDFAPAGWYVLSILAGALTAAQACSMLRGMNMDSRVPRWIRLLANLPHRSRARQCVLRAIKPGFARRLLSRLRNGSRGYAISSQSGQARAGA